VASTSLPSLFTGENLIIDFSGEVLKAEIGIVYEFGIGAGYWGAREFSLICSLMLESPAGPRALMLDDLALSKCSLNSFLIICC
jgi:hypothetical protein